ncbi:MAG TPA: putative lipopolysaccharide heptosyltransferase III [Nitrospiraceae bacterium]|jgi:predicted lipopolysaccharide heptosyltransferase III|nr:putative lipopolysaccharide heptosyltransferase III [Nitrospiraceae bacterium]
MICNNILVIKLRHIGDVLLSTPVVRSLRKAFPHARLTMLVNRGTEAVLRNNSDLDEIKFAEKSTLVGQWRFMQALRRAGYDCVVDLTDGDRSAFLSLATGAAVRIGFNAEHRWRGLLYSHVVRALPGDEHRIEYDLGSLRPMGLTPATHQPILRISEDDAAAARAALSELGLGNGSPAPIVAMQPGARYSLKVWPAERYAELADRLSKDLGCRILLGGDQREREVAEEVQRRATCNPLVIAGRFPLLQFAALLRSCDLFVGNDGGAMHVAATIGVPVVALFGPTYPQRWGPRGAPSRIIYKGLDCRACYHPVCLRGDDNCMRLITVNEVFDACVALLAKAGKASNEAGLLSSQPGDMRPAGPSMSIG